MKGRIEDRCLLDTYHDMSCMVCNRRGDVVAHHLVSRKSYGPDVKENLIPLCVEHHNEIHFIGRTTFAYKYPLVKVFLMDNGWEYCDMFKKWFPPKF